MRHHILKADQRAATGFTDLYVISAARDFATSTTDDLLLNIKLDTLDLGDVVRNHTLAEIKKIFAPVPSANAVVTVSAGRTGSSYVDLLAASNLVNSTAIPVNTAYAAGEAIADVLIAADDTAVYAQIDITDTDGDIATMTSGEVWIWMAISRKIERSALGDA